eukprot:795612-Prymnesium_polylepis.1
MGVGQGKAAPVLATGVVGAGVDVVLKELAKGEQDRLVWNMLSLLHVATLTTTTCEFTGFNMGKLSDASAEMLYMMPLLQGKLAIIFVFDAVTQEGMRQSVAALRRLHSNYERSAKGSSSPFGGALLLVLVRCTLSYGVQTEVDTALAEARSVIKSLGIADAACHVQPMDGDNYGIALQAGLLWIRTSLGSARRSVKGKGMPVAEIRRKHEPQHEVDPPILS